MIMGIKPFHELLISYIVFARVDHFSISSLEIFSPFMTILISLGVIASPLIFVITLDTSVIVLGVGFSGEINWYLVDHPNLNPLI